MRLVSKHFTRRGADVRLLQETQKLQIRGRSSGWESLKFYVKPTGNKFRRWMVIEK